MRALFLLGCLLLSANYLFAQSFPDSVWLDYYKKTSGSEKGKIIRKYINFQYQGTEEEKLKLLFNTRAKLLERKDVAGVDYCNIMISIYSWKIGDYNRAIKEGLEILPNFEKRKDTFGMFYTLNSIAIASVDAKSNEQAIGYMKRAQIYAEALNDTGGVITILNNIADNYFKSGRNDSALMFIQMAFQKADRYYAERGMEKIFLLSLTLSTMGDVYIARKECDIATPFIYRAVDAALKDQDTATASYNYSNLAECFFMRQQYDSSLFYAKLALRLSEPFYKPEMLKAYEGVYKSYRQLQQGDSVYTYFLLAMNLKDSLFSLEKTKNIQHLNFQEQIREQEKADEERRWNEERKRNLQYIAIVIFILTLVIFVFMLRKKKPDLKTIEYLGMLAVLLLFEFLYMILHPFLERITHHNAILMLLCLVAIGAVIAPVHHKLTEYVKRKAKK